MNCRQLSGERLISWEYRLIYMISISIDSFEKFGYNNRNNKYSADSRLSKLFEIKTCRGLEILLSR